jgi:carboxylesterase type B
MALFFCMRLLFFIALSAFCKSQLVVNTTDGPVQGLDCGLGVECFLGIPYASAQRFHDPKRLTPRPSVYVASKFSDGCPQNCTIPGQAPIIPAKLVN